MTKKPEVTCYICKRTFQKEVHGAAHNRNYYRCAECLRTKLLENHDVMVARGEAEPF